MKSGVDKLRAESPGLVSHMSVGQKWFLILQSENFGEMISHFKALKVFEKVTKLVFYAQAVDIVISG